MTVSGILENEHIARRAVGGGEIGVGVAVDRRPAATAAYICGHPRARCVQAGVVAKLIGLAADQLAACSSPGSTGAIVLPDLAGSLRIPLS